VKYLWPWRRKLVLDPLAAQAEATLVDLERRADKVEPELRERKRRNGFAEGIAIAWDSAPPTHHRRGS
jgi:hypothetical protein